MTQETNLSTKKYEENIFLGGQGGWGGWGMVWEREIFFFLKLGPKRSTRFLKEEYEKKKHLFGVSEDF
jgi:hypothetical protein